MPVIDNDEALVELESFYLIDAGYTVYTALDGDVGVKLNLQHKPSAITCDIIIIDRVGEPSDTRPGKAEL